MLEIKGLRPVQMENVWWPNTVNVFIRCKINIFWSFKHIGLSIGKISESWNHCFLALIILERSRKLLEIKMTSKWHHQAKEMWIRIDMVQCLAANSSVISLSGMIWLKELFFLDSGYPFTSDSAKSKFDKFSKITNWVKMNNKQYHGIVLLNSFPMNFRVLSLESEGRKLCITQGSTLGIKGLILKFWLVVNKLDIKSIN